MINTFVSIAEIKSIRMILAISNFYDYEVWEMDVITAFLNGKLSKEVFITQPKGYEHSKYHDRVYKLE